MKTYLIVEFDQQTLRPYIKKVHEISVRDESELKKEIADIFNEGDFNFMDNMGIICVDECKFGNTGKLHHNEIYWDNIAMGVVSER